MEPFIGLDDLSDVLGEDVTTSDVAVIAIDSACQAIRDVLGNEINLAEDDEITLDGNGRARLILPEGPVREVSEVTIIVVGDGSDEPMTSTDYTLEDGRTWRGMFLRRVGPSTTYPIVWPIGLGNIAITYSHGYDVTEPASEPPEGFERVPSSIRKVALSLASRIYSANSGGTTAGAVTGEKIGGYSYTVDTASAVALSSVELLETELGTLKPYRELMLR